MIGLVYLAAVALGAGCLFVRIARRVKALDAPTDGGRERPCDLCPRLVPPARAHTHHHEPGCGVAGPTFERCSCSFYLCSECCPCDVSGLIAS